MAQFVDTEDVQSCKDGHRLADRNQPHNDTAHNYNFK